MKSLLSLILLAPPLLNLLLLSCCSKGIILATDLVNCLHVCRTARFGPMACIWLLLSTTSVYRLGTLGLAVMMPPSLKLVSCGILFLLLSFPLHYNFLPLRVRSKNICSALMNFHFHYL